MSSKYSLIIRWSEEDHCYIAWCPEFGAGVKTHGATYEKAARAGQEIIDLWIQTHGDEQIPLPEPWHYESQDDQRLGQYLLPDNAAYKTPKVIHGKKKVKNVPA